MGHGAGRGVGRTALASRQVRPGSRGFRPRLRGTEGRVSGIYLPTVEEIGTLLRDLVGAEVKVEAGSPPGLAAVTRVGVYLTRDDRIAAVLAADDPAVVGLGGALAMTSPSAVQEALAAGEIPEELAGAFSEVANIAASLMCRDGYPHVRLDAVYARKEAPVKAKGTLGAPQARVDCRVTLDAYVEGGCFSFLVAKLD